MSTPFLYESGAVASVDKAKAELAKPDGGIEVNHGFRFELLNNQLEMSGHFNLLREGKAQIENLGPNASLQGKGERSASGRAILANQQGGQIEIHRLLDRHNDFKRRVYQLIWQMVRLYWTDEKWVRVTDDEKNTRFVGLNRPVTFADELLTKAVASGRSEEEVKAQLAQMAKDPLTGEELDRVVRVENIPAEMNMDIIIEEVPDVANIQDEQFQTLAKLAAAGISFPPEVYIKASGLRDKRDLLKFLEKQQENPAGLELQKLQVQKLAAEVEKLRAQIGDIRAGSTKKLAEVDALDGRMDGRVTQPIVETQPPEADDLLNGAPPPEPPFPGSPQEASQELFTPTDL